MVLQRNEARALREHGDGLQLLWRASFDGVRTFLLEHNVQGSIQRSNGLRVVVVAIHDIEAYDQEHHRREGRGACDADATRRSFGFLFGKQAKC